jgi:hypothetical protein
MCTCSNTHHPSQSRLWMQHEFRSCSHACTQQGIGLMHPCCSKPLLRTAQQTCCPGNALSHPYALPLGMLLHLPQALQVVGYDVSIRNGLNLTSLAGLGNLTQVICTGAGCVYVCVQPVHRGVVMQCKASRRAVQHHDTLQSFVPDTSSSHCAGLSWCSAGGG